MYVFGSSFNRGPDKTGTFLFQSAPALFQSVFRPVLKLCLRRITLDGLKWSRERETEFSNKRFGRFSVRSERGPLRSGMLQRVFIAGDLSGRIGRKEAGLEAEVDDTVTSQSHDCTNTIASSWDVARCDQRQYILNTQLWRLPYVLKFIYNVQICCMMTVDQRVESLILQKPHLARCFHLSVITQISYLTHSSINIKWKMALTSKFNLCLAQLHYLEI